LGRVYNAAQPERWRLAGWTGGVRAAEWEACAGVLLPANVWGLAVRRRGRRRASRRGRQRSVAL